MRVEAMAVKDFFFKVLVERGTMKILGAHVIGPYASMPIQEVVERACRGLMTPEQYHHLLEHHYNVQID